MFFHTYFKPLTCLLTLTIILSNPLFAQKMQASLPPLSIKSLIGNKDTLYTEGCPSSF